jgi:hypothetical protein
MATCTWLEDGICYDDRKRRYGCYIANTKCKSELLQHSIFSPLRAQTFIMSWKYHSVDGVLASCFSYDESDISFFGDSKVLPWPIDFKRKSKGLVYMMRVVRFNEQ